MQGACSYSFASLDEFWSGQKHIKLLDPNITACPQWETNFDTLIDSRTYVDFTQGLDVRLLDDQKLDKLRQIRTKRLHFAWDNPQDDLIRRFRHVQTAIGGKRYNRSVYILTNFDSTHEQDVYRVETIKAMGWQPYVMIYDKPHAPALTRKLQRYANSPPICWSNRTFEEYLKKFSANRD